MTRTKNPELLSLKQPFILNGFNQRLSHSDVVGSFSVKSVFSGRATYGIEGSHTIVDSSRYLILNHAQPYDMWIESDTPVETFCIFFPRRWLADVYQNLMFTDDYLLCNPYDATQPFLFFEVPHNHDQGVTPMLKLLRDKYRNSDYTVSQITPIFYTLIEKLIASQRDTYKSALTIPAVKISTRLELFRRLHLAKEYMMANFHQSDSLVEFAKIACMSPFHFLRRFTDAFGMTPHKFIMQLRLNEAEQLLITSRLSITEICMYVGFTSLGSFSTLFRKQYGLSPRQFRQEHNT